MREIVLDTETTGLDPARGDRIVEIGAVEVVNAVRTGAHFHVYINPERDMPDEAYAVHGLSAAFLAQHGVFREVADRFLAFVEGATLVIHNAEFDMRFINAELGLLGLPPIGMGQVVDTLALARRRHPGSPASLDALCQRYRIDNSKRVKHGALVDAEILADVYAELLGGRQGAFGLHIVGEAQLDTGAAAPARRRPVPLPSRLTTAEREAHADFVATLGVQPVWALYPEPVPPAAVAALVDRELAAVAE